MSTLAAQFLDSLATGPRAPLPTREAVTRSSRPGRVRSRKGRERKGRELQLLARDYFEAQAMIVEIAQKKVLWIPGKDGRRIPISRNHDLFGVWDLVVVDWSKTTRRAFFVQVTTLDNVAAKRTKIHEAKFPTTSDDVILGHEGGRRFRLLRGPAFAMPGTTMEVAK